MSDIDLTPKLLASMASRPRVRARYSASDLFFIFSGKTTPEEWLQTSPRSMEDMFKMWDGNMIHHAIQELLQRKYKEEKREFPCPFGFVIVGKADYLPTEKDGVPEEDEVWEFKSSNKTMKTAKPWHLHQTKMYCSLFGKKKGRIFQPVRTADKVILKEIGVVERDDNWFMDEMRKLNEFHLQLETLWESERLKMEPLPV